MNKKFYKKRPTEKIFFMPGIKMKTYAIGDKVHKDFIEWRKQYIDKWNSQTSRFYLLESGSIDGNAAKINKVGEFSIAELDRAHGGISRSEGKITPLWLGDFYLEVGEYGELIVNGAETETILINDVKAWGIDIADPGDDKGHTLFVFGNNDSGESELRAYKMSVGREISLSLVTSVTFEITNSRKAHIFCMRSHIFLINEMKLHYFYYNSAFSRLEEVAIDSDEPNAGKPFCTNVDSSIVCNSDGCVFWTAENAIYFFPIGYPKSLRSIELGENYEVLGIQTFRSSLYIYFKSKITREYASASYIIENGEIKESSVFNRDVKYNLFYAEKNGELHYLKISPFGREAFVARTSPAGEVIVKEIDIGSSDQCFCINGDLYKGYCYVSIVK